MLNQQQLSSFIMHALEEDLGDGDHTTLSSIPEDKHGNAALKVKEDGIVAGVEVAKAVFQYLDPEIRMEVFLPDGSEIKIGDIVFRISGKVHALLSGERVALNCMQRMSGIATLTNEYAKKLSGYHSRLLDTRKTTPAIRFLEKEAVKIGGGQNHRMGLYDMILLKDNHIDFCGGIRSAIEQARRYLQEKHLDIPIEVEARSLDDVREILTVGKANRIMFDNFTPAQTGEAVKLVAGRFETESSGNINLDTIEEYAKTGVDFISCGAVIHHAVSLDLSLKAVF